MVGLGRIRWWQWIPRPTWRVVGRVGDGDEIPDRLPKRGVVIAGTPAQPKWVAFDCPCGRGHRILVNLDRRRRPVWSMVRADPLTLKPSIDYGSAEHRCHFVLQGGKIKWILEKEDEE